MASIGERLKDIRLMEGNVEIQNGAYRGRVEK